MESVRDHYKLLNRMLSLAGLWPYQSKRTRLFRVCFLTAIAVSLIIPQMAQINHCDKNLRCIFLAIPATLLMFMILLKVHTCQFNISKIKKLTNHLHEDWEKLESVKEYEIMKTYAAHARLLSLTYCLCGYVGAYLYMLITLLPRILNIMLPLNESRPLVMLYDAYYFVDSEEYYFYIFIHNLVGMSILMVGILAHDCMFITYIEHVCSLFAIAGFHLETVSCNDRNDAAHNSRDAYKIYNRKIAISVHVHWRAIWVAEHLDDTFSSSFVIQMMITTTMISITLLQMALQIEEIIVTLKCMVYVMAQLLHTFIYSVQGQKLIDHSTQLREKIYNSFWYEIPVKSQKLLLFVMRRGLEPNFLSAGRIYVFSLTSFTTVLQSAISYFTVLSSFH